MRVCNIAPLLQEVKLRTVSFCCDLAQGSVEIMNLPLVTRVIRRVGQEAFPINNREDRIEDAPLGFAIGLQESIAKISALAKAGAHFAG